MVPVCWCNLEEFADDAWRTHAHRGETVFVMFGSLGKLNTVQYCSCVTGHVRGRHS